MIIGVVRKSYCFYCRREITPTEALLRGVCFDCDKKHNLK